MYFAFALALFLGFQAGFIIGAADSPNAYLVASIIVTVLLAVGASRFWSVWMMRMGWIKPRAQKRR